MVIERQMNIARSNDVGRVRDVVSTHTPSLRLQGCRSFVRAIGGTDISFKLKGNGRKIAYLAI
jgi:hypothetical protein